MRTRGGLLVVGGIVSWGTWRTPLHSIRLKHWVQQENGHTRQETGLTGTLL